MRRVDLPSARRPPSGPGLIALSWLAVVLLGCEQGCPQVTRCDVREKRCQRNTLEAVACMRGGGSDGLPKVSVISERELVERSTSVEPEHAEARAEAAATQAIWNRGLSLFGLARTGYDLDDEIADAAAETAAAYFPGQDEIVIVDRGEPLSDELAVEALAHEIVHALQDREYGLAALGDEHATSFDAGLALDGLIEGEAMLYQLLVSAQLAGQSAEDIDWRWLYDQYRRDTLREADADDAPLSMAGLRFPYAFGGGFVTQHWLERGRAGIDELFETPPRTTSEVLFGTRGKALEAAREALAPRAVPDLDAAFEQRTVTALGAWIALVYAVRAGVEVDERLKPASELGADVFSVHYDEDVDRVVAAWRARMLDDAAATSWPRSPNPGSLRTLDESERESAQLAGDFALSTAFEELAWREASVAEATEEDAATSMVPAVRFPRLQSQLRACPIPRWHPWSP